MKPAAVYSHLNGREHILVHKPEVWHEIEQVIASVDAGACLTKRSIEMLPMKALQSEMSSGVPYYEGELYNLLRQGRSTPAVPLVLIGVAP